jgi:hypothetical protein
VAADVTFLATARGLTLEPRDPIAVARRLLAGTPALAELGAVERLEQTWALLRPREAT